MRPRTLAIALGLSLVVNVFVIGAFAGVYFTRGFGRGQEGGSRHNPLMAAAARLDPTDRDVFRALMQDQVQRERPTLLDARAARRQAAALMRAPTFDRTAAGAALDRARADDSEVRQKLENAMLDFAARLDTQGRAILADGLGHGPGWRGRHDDGSASGKAP